MPSGSPGHLRRIASTEVQTDILFLRKRQRAEAVEAKWLKLGTVPDSLRHPQCYERYLPINAWYAEHPQFCIGRIRRESNGYEEVPVAVFEGDLEAALAERIALLPPVLYRPVAHKAAPLRVVVPAEAGARPGSYRLHQGRVHRVEGSEMVDVHDQLNATQRARVTGLCAIRDHARPCSMRSWRMRATVGWVTCEPCSMGPTSALCVAYGCLSTRANALAFRRDPDYPLLLSLEHYDEVADTARKAALFHRRTLTRVVEPSTAGEPAEALAASVQWRGRVDPAFTWPNCWGTRRRCWRRWPGGAGFPRPGRRGMEDRRRLPVGQRESEAQAGGAVRGLPTSATSTRWNRCNPKTCHRRPSSRAWARCGFRPSTSRRSSSRSWNSRTARWATRPKPAPGR